MDLIEVMQEEMVRHLFVGLCSGHYANLASNLVTWLAPLKPATLVNLCTRFLYQK